MKKSRHISILLLLVIAITFTFQLISGLLCDCDGHTHNGEYICVHLNHHHTHTKTCEGTCTLGESCLHFKVIDLDVLVPASLNDLTPTLFYSTMFQQSIALMLQTLDSRLASSPYEHPREGALLESQWKCAPLYQRPPPALV